ncbi:MAG: hypothetical protein EOO24_03965, partial [Comamonadaceae bacterium]
RMPWLLPAGSMRRSCPVRSHWSVPVRAGQLLRMEPAGRSQGIRSWLAVAGGIDVAPVLGSRSTDLKAAFGGHHGRALRKDDRLPIGRPAWSAPRLAQPAFGLRSPDWWMAGEAAVVEAGGKRQRPSEPSEDTGALRVRVLPGPDYEQFTAASRTQLWSADWRLTTQSNRMGARLAGPELQRRRPIELLSAGVVPGVIQVPPSGQPIVLMGDAQTTGGYPRIGVVLQADLGALARWPLQGLIRFVEADAAAAQAARSAQRRYLDWVNTALAAMAWSRPAESRASNH